MHPPVHIFIQPLNKPLHQKLFKFHIHTCWGRLSWRPRGWLADSLSWLPSWMGAGIQRRALWGVWRIPPRTQPIRRPHRFSDACYQRAQSLCITPPPEDISRRRNCWNGVDEVNYKNGLNGENEVNCENDVNGGNGLNDGNGLNGKIG